MLVSFHPNCGKATGEDKVANVQLIFELNGEGFILRSCTANNCCAPQNKEIANIITTSAYAKESASPIINTSVHFTDVSEEQWGYESVQSAVKARYMSGYTDGIFRPDAEVTEEEFLSMMVKALNVPVDTNMAGSSWFSPY